MLLPDWGLSVDEAILFVELEEVESQKILHTSL